ncbi:MAG: hypothetical protein IPJ84_09585 [Bdellovibrionales bacterium]|nr:hypothetical protein [Bdellovibrionales bacterium]
MTNLMSSISVVAVLLLSVNSGSASEHCDVQAMQKKSDLRFFRGANVDEEWLSTSEDASRLFRSLGMVENQQHDSKRRIANLEPCEVAESDYQHYSRNDLPMSLLVTGSCSRRLAVKLGLAPVVIENYGSMESPTPVVWSGVSVCTDGKTISMCDKTTKAMNQCLIKLIRRRSSQ